MLKALHVVVAKVGLDDDVDDDVVLGAFEVCVGLSSMFLKYSNDASNLRFDSMPRSMPFLTRISRKEVGRKGCKLVERSLGVEALAAPLLAEPAGDEGSEAIRYCTGCIGIGGLPAAVCTATASCGRE